MPCASTVVLHVLVAPDPYLLAQAAQELLMAVLMHRALQVALQMCLSLEDVATVLAGS